MMKPGDKVAIEIEVVEVDEFGYASARPVTPGWFVGEEGRLLASLIEPSILNKL